MTLASAADITDEQKTEAQNAVKALDLNAIRGDLNNTSNAINNLVKGSSIDDAVAAINEAIANNNTSGLKITFAPEQDDLGESNTGKIALDGHFVVEGSDYIYDNAADDIMGEKTFNVNYYSSQYIAEQIKSHLNLPANISANADGSDAAANAEAYFEDQLSDGAWYEKVTGKLGGYGVFVYDLNAVYNNSDDTVTVDITVSKAEGVSDQSDSVQLGKFDVVRADNRAKEAFDELQKELSKEENAVWC